MDGLKMFSLRPKVLFLGTWPTSSLFSFSSSCPSKWHRMSEEKKYSESSSGSNESSALDSSQDIKPFDVSKLPESFQKFLEVNEIDPAIYTVADLPRYVRWNTQIEEGKRPSLDDLRRQLGTENVWCVSGRPGFFGFVGAKNRLVDTEV